MPLLTDSRYDDSPDDPDASQENVNVENLHGDESIDQDSAKETVSPTLVFSTEMPTTHEVSGNTTLQNKWCFWYMRRNAANKADSYEQNIKAISSFSTVESFWHVYNHIARPGDIAHTTDLILFRDGVKPMWEDPNNKRGGKWMVRLKKGLGARYWEELLLGIIGEQFDVGNEICGAIISVRFTEDIISIWNRTADNHEALAKIKDNFRRICRMPQWITLDYKRHDTAMTGGEPAAQTPSYRSLPLQSRNSISGSLPTSSSTSTSQAPAARQRPSFGSRALQSSISYDERSFVASGSGDKEGYSGYRGGNRDRERDQQEHPQDDAHGSSEAFTTTTNRGSPRGFQERGSGSAWSRGGPFTSNSGSGNTTRRDYTGPATSTSWRDRKPN